MATSYKVLGQSTPSATTNTTLYTVPTSTSAVCSTLAICNRSTLTTFRVAIRPAGAALADQHYLVYDTEIRDNETIFITIGVTMSATDVVTIYAGTANLSFSLFGSEIV